MQVITREPIPRARVEPFYVGATSLRPQPSSRHSPCGEAFTPHWWDTTTCHENATPAQRRGAVWRFTVFTWTLRGPAVSATSRLVTIGGSLDERVCTAPTRCVDPKPEEERDSRWAYYE